MSKVTEKSGPQTIIGIAVPTNCDPFRLFWNWEYEYLYPYIAFYTCGTAEEQLKEP